MMSSEVAVEEIMKKTIPIVIKYGPRIINKILPKKFEVRLQSAIIFTFYNSISCEKANEFLSTIIDKYCIKEGNRTYLKINKNSIRQYEYDISIVPKDGSFLIETFDIFKLDTILEIEEKLTALLTSSARLYLWPSISKENLSIKEFKDTLFEIFLFYKRVNDKINDEIKNGQIGSTKISLHYKLVLNPKEFRKMVNKIIKRIEGDELLQQKIYVRNEDYSINIFADDSSVIGALIDSVR
jgi:hypothetical protein